MPLNQSKNSLPKNGPIIVFADKIYQKFYKNFSLIGEKILVFPCDESPQILKVAHADIILIDCGFNIKMGLKLLSKIKRTYPEVPILLLTDKSTQESILEAFRSGVRDYFRKPVNIHELKDKIKNLLKIKRSATEKRSPYVIRKSKFGGDDRFLVTSDKPVNILRTIDYMEENLTERINLTSCAKVAKLSKHHFCRVFKKNIGMSPMKFVMFLRINRAKELLKKDELNLLEVALATGINEQNRFTRAFKEFTGVTPSKYKKSIKAK